VISGSEYHHTFIITLTCRFTVHANNFVVRIGLCEIYWLVNRLDSIL